MTTEPVAAPHFGNASWLLLEELSFGVTATPTATAVLSPQQAVNPATLPAPPAPARLVTVTAQFPSKTSRSREPSAQEPLQSLAALEETDSTAPIARQASGAGPPKRRTLVSLASLPAIPVVSSEYRVGGSKPKSALKGTTSTFVKSYEGLPLSSSALRNLGPTLGGEVDWGFWTCGKHVYWADLHPTKAREPIAKLTFSIAPTALAVANNATPDRVEVLIGFATGDLLLLDPICARYTRFNKAGSVSSSPVTCLEWLPSTSGTNVMFASGHADGCVVVWDREREDGQFIAPAPLPRKSKFSRPARSTASSASLDEPYVESAEDIVVTTPPLPPSERKGKPGIPLNPVAHWRICRGTLTDLAFSPDGQHCAVVSDDGVLRIIDVNAERLLDAFGSYFGGLTTVSWSPDGRFVLTGGEDDLVCVYAPSEQRIVARCQGHASFVAGVAFDAHRSDERTSRFASVGDDRRLIFWDLSNASLRKPKAAHQPYLRRVSAASSLSLTRRRTLDSAVHLPLMAEDGGPVWHAPLSRSEVSILQPTYSQCLASDLLTRVIFLREVLVALTKGGKVLIYSRPELQERQKL